MDDRLEVLDDIVPPAPNDPPDLDAIGDRFTALCEARATGNDLDAALLEVLCANDVPALVAEIARLQREVTSWRYPAGTVQEGTDRG